MSKVGPNCSNCSMIPPKKPEDGCCALVPNGLRAASSWKGSVCFWDLESGVLIRKHRNKSAGVRFTPDGLRALTRGGTGYVLWDLETGKKISAIAGATERVLGEEIISPTNSLVAKVAPFKRHNQQGEVCSVSKWMADDMPFTETQLVNYAWYDDDRLATWRDVLETDTITTGEIRLWTLNPLKLIGASKVEPPLLPIQNEDKPARRAVQFYRIVTAESLRMVFAGDGNAYVYGFQVDC